MEAYPCVAYVHGASVGACALCELLRDVGCVNQFGVAGVAAVGCVIGGDKAPVYPHTIAPPILPLFDMAECTLRREGAVGL